MMKLHRRIFCGILTALSSHATLSLLLSRRSQRGVPLTLDDRAGLRDIRDPQCSPEGSQVAYVVSSIDTKDDKSALISTLLVSITLLIDS
jgi:hypothetical protein